MTYQMWSDRLQMFTSRIYGSLVQTRTVEIQLNRDCFYYMTEIWNNGVAPPEIQMWRLEHLEATEHEELHFNIEQDIHESSNSIFEEK